MPRPANKERRGFVRLVEVCIYSFLGLLVVGYLFLWFYPPTERDKRCLRVPMAQMKQCMWEFQHDK